MQNSHISHHYPRYTLAAKNKTLYISSLPRTMGLISLVFAWPSDVTPLSSLKSPFLPIMKLHFAAITFFTRLFLRHPPEHLYIYNWRAATIRISIYSYDSYFCASSHRAYIHKVERNSPRAHTHTFYILAHKESIKWVFLRQIREPARLYSIYFIQHLERKISAILFRACCIRIFSKIWGEDVLKVVAQRTRSILGY